MRGEVEALQDGINLPTESSFASLHQEVNQLQRLIDDLYQLAMSDSGALTYIMKPVDMINVLQDCLSGYENQFKTISLQVTLMPLAHTSLLVLGDEQRLQQLIYNLLENTRRYTDSPGQLVISTQFKNGQLGIVLEDSALSVPAESLPHLFERLYVLSHLAIVHYICKPFSPREVLARIKAVLRRSQIQPLTVLPVVSEVNKLILDESRLVARFNIEEIDLTMVEFKLLSIMYQQAGRIFSRDQLMSHIYSDHRIVSERTIDSHIKKLRKKKNRYACT